MYTTAKAPEIKEGKGHLLTSFLILPLTFCCFYFLPQLLGKTAGYLTSFGVYWAYCLLHGAQLKQDALKQFYQWPRLQGKNLLVVVLCFVPVVGAFTASFLVAYPALTTETYLLLIGAAVVNGAIEEFYWRGAFVSRFKNNTLYAFLVPTVLFGLWHISVYAAHGVEYQGGFMPLVGGAFFMGLLWGYTAYKQQRILAPTLAHILTNFFAFSNLIVENWVN